MKLDGLGKTVLVILRGEPNLTAKDILSRGIGDSEPQIELIITQLRTFGFI